MPADKDAMAAAASFEDARTAHADARWAWHLARERGRFLAMLDAEIAAAAAVERMEAALARMQAALARTGLDPAFCAQNVRDYVAENEEQAAVAPFWGRIARGEEEGGATAP